jgi:hypothetical protein
MKSQRVQAHQEEFKAGEHMSETATGESGASSMRLEVANPDPETAEGRGLNSFNWEVEASKRLRLNEEQVGRKAPRPRWRTPAAQKAGPRMERMGQPVLLPHPNPQPPNIRPALGAPAAPERHPLDPKPILPRLLPRSMHKEAIRRKNKIASTLPAFNPPVAVKEESRMFMPVLETLSSRPESQSNTPPGNDGWVFRSGGRFGKGVWLKP